MMSTKKRALATGLALIAASTHISARAASSPSGQRLRIIVDGQEIRGTLNSSPAANEFAAILPLTFSMRDLLSREKISPLPRPLTHGTVGEPVYTVGELGYWQPENNFVVYYKSDGTRLPPPGIVPLGQLEGGAERFIVKSDLEIKVEIAK